MKFISLISSGIDSPVSTYLLSKYADEIILVHGDIKPFTDEREVKNFKLLVKHLKKIISCPMKVYVVSHGGSLSSFKQFCNNKYTCVFCKRTLLRYAEKIAEKENADAIIMGDSLGQVASQTLQNIKVVDNAVKIPVLRPLIGFDKEDAVKLAKDIGTYELSILPTDGCSAVPSKPSTMAKIDKILEEESKIDVNNLVKNAIDSVKILEI
jgi:thiamine biosynthesis protein ThiI